MKTVLAIFGPSPEFIHEMNVSFQTLYDKVNEHGNTLANIHLLLAACGVVIFWLGYVAYRLHCRLSVLERQARLPEPPQRQ